MSSICSGDRLRSLRNLTKSLDRTPGRHPTGEHGLLDLVGSWLCVVIGEQREGRPLGADFYPEGASPQLSAQTVIVGTPMSSTPRLERDYAEKRDANMSASLTTIPAEPAAGNRTQVRLMIDAAHGLQQYLGAWAHMLAASSNLIDMQHEHPYRTDGDKEIEFQVTFPRTAEYRLWIQVQSEGIVSTVRFDVPVTRSE